MITEGTYPFNHGGVSTWAHNLCNEITNVDYTLYAINAMVEPKPKYKLSNNVKKVIQVPMWSAEEPFDCVYYDVKYSDVIYKRERTSTDAISQKFVPYFITFIKEIYSKEQSVTVLDDCFYNMWLFFNDYDYKVAMTSKPVWDAFTEVLKSTLPQNELVKLSLEDVTIAMRWIYRFLIPIAIDVPKADVSHITISGIAVLPALCLKYKYNTPILVTEHGVFIRERLIAISAADYSYFLKKMLIHFSECITKLVYYHAAKITSVSKFNIAWQKHYGADVNKTKVIYNGVDPNVFVPRNKPKHLENTPTVVAAARIFDLKDILTMIRTCNEVRKTIPNVQFLVYGNKDAVPEYTKECQNLIEELNLSKNFKLAGFHSTPEAIYSEGDISILTSISEGFPFTVIESMSCGVPVVATDVGGVSEAIDDSCGFICKPKNYIEIAEKVTLLLNDVSLRNWMAENGRKKIQENFTIKNFIHEFEETYELLNTKNKISKLASFPQDEPSFTNYR
ncbi:GT4 family glycosyltransferase PelF [Cellulophaga omnivescoria]|uniref:GT4 family glycosyltransferase PelF n=1 Tax=Cellulophaga omnivescoria TaxID=1888890 RepID=UPI0022F04C8D|nr:GT4 family glycosyltransferase PelF [Cellulophaga omnivescoria]WBU87879.1 GT4 family glycosyltransferase PelF [Cellulophaga omnivescoria]WKB79873.1 GT4 family glycosyltransferase PelF [Cellulophaga lytica]